MNLFAAMARQPRLVRSVPAAGDYIDPLQVSADGERIAVPDDKGDVHLYDAATSELLDSYPTGAVSERRSPAVLGARVQPRGRVPRGRHRCPTTSVRCGCWTRTPWRRPGPPSTCRAGAPTRVHRPRLQRGRPISRSGHATHPGRARASAIGDPSFVLVWDLRSPDRPPELVRTGARLQGLALSPDGRTVYTSIPLTAYDVATGRTGVVDRVQLVVGRSTSARTAGCSPPRSTRSNSGPIRLTDARTGETCGSCAATRTSPATCASRDDGSRLASVSLGRPAHRVGRVRPASRCVTTDTFEVGWSVDFSPDGHRVYTGGDDAMLRTWDLYGDQQFLRRMFALRGGQDFIDVHASPDGRRLAYLFRRTTQGSVLFLDTVTGRGRTRASAASFLSQTWRGGPGIPMAGTMRCSETPLAWSRCWMPRRGTDAPPRCVKDADIYSIGLRRQGRTADRRGQRRAG